MGNEQRQGRRARQDGATERQSVSRRRPPWARWQKWAVGILGGLAVLLFAVVVGATGSGSDDDSEDEAHLNPVASETADVPEPDRFTIEHDDDDLDGLLPGGTTFVRFDIADNFSQGMIASAAERDTFKAVQLALDEHPDTGRVAVEGSFPTVDDHGNTSDTVIMRAHYDRETLDRINFDNQASVEIWAIRDGGAIHPDLLGD